MEMISWFGKLLDDLKTVDINPETNEWLRKWLEPIGEGDEVIGEVDDYSKRLFALCQEYGKRIEELRPKPDMSAEGPKGIMSIVKKVESISKEASLVKNLAWHNVETTLRCSNEETKLKIDSAGCLTIGEGWKLISVKNKGRIRSGIEDFLDELPPGVSCVVVGGSFR